MGKKNEKTNVMRLLDGARIEYIPHEYDPSVTDGVTIASTLGEDEEKVFKTLVTEAPGGLHFVFVIPVGSTLDLKAAAKAAGVKSISMIKQKELLPLTGYVHGGCSPVGMKKQFPTFVHETAQEHDHIFVSAGKVGLQVELTPADLQAVVGFKYADVVKADAE